jgi:hypothetical protein
LKILPHLSFTKGGDHDFPLRKRGAVKKLEYAPLTLPSPARGEGEHTKVNYPAAELRGIKNL